MRDLAKYRVPPPDPLTFLKQNGVWGLVPSGLQGQSPGLLLPAFLHKVRI
jgi:hypothetical protein